MKFNWTFFKKLKFKYKKQNSPSLIPQEGWYLNPGYESTKDDWVKMKLSIAYSYRDVKWFTENGWRNQQLLVNLIRLKLI